jgi:hypothetical protein
MNRNRNIRDFQAGIQWSSLIFTGCMMFCLMPDTIQGQATIGARAMALGQTGAALPDDNWALFQNPSLLRTDGYAISFYGMRYAGLAEITDLAAAGSVDTPAGVFGAGFHRYGFDLFNETRIRLGYKNRLDLFHYGVALNYSHVAQGGRYGSAGAIGIDAGLAAEAGSRILVGARAVNLNRPAYGDSEEELPRELAIGVSGKMSDSLLALLELVKDVRFPLSVRSGVEIRLIPALSLRAGVTTDPLTWSLGLGIKTGRLSLNFAVQNHQPLGLSPAIDFGLNDSPLQGR